ncbi:hypothetical protein ABI59_02670 [Acidobacteria bacterium Mor1]|nr:hypothetical protein ABI59_02670 [Acidobacteria bacterium Mor1]
MSEATPQLSAGPPLAREVSRGLGLGDDESLHPLLDEAGGLQVIADSDAAVEWLVVEVARGGNAERCLLRIVAAGDSRRDAEQELIGKVAGSEGLLRPYAGRRPRSVAPVFPAAGWDASKRSWGDPAVGGPLAGGPWSGVLTEPTHVSMLSWLRLVEGKPWSKVRAGVSGSRWAECGGFRTASRLRLYGALSADAFIAETLLLKLEMLRQLVSGVSRLSEAADGVLDHRVGRLRVHSGPGDSLRPAFWDARAELGDLLPAAEGVPEYLASRQGGGGDWIAGLCLPRGKEQAGATEVRLDFIPDERLSEPPEKGSSIRLGIPENGDAPAREIDGEVELGYPEICRLVLRDPEIIEELSRDLLGRLSQPGVKMRSAGGAQLPADLFVAGTYWIAWLLDDPSDLQKAARFRDAAEEKIRGLDPVRAAAEGPAEVRRLAATSGFFPDWVGKHGTLATAALGLGLRLCAVLPLGGEGDAPWQAARAAIDELASGLRRRMVRPLSPAAEVLSVVRDYARARAGR